MNTATAVALTPIPRAQYIKEVGLMSAGHGLTHWYPATFYLLLPLIGKELGLTYTQIGFILTTQHIVGAIANLPGGAIVDACGKKGYLLTLALFWIGMPYAVMSMAHSYWVLLVCMALVGIGNNIWHPAAIPMLAYRYPDRKGFVLSVHGMFGNLGEALAPLVIGAPAAHPEVTRNPARGLMDVPCAVFVAFRKEDGVRLGMCDWGSSSGDLMHVDCPRLA